MYEFTGQDSAGFRGGEVEFQVSEFFEPGVCLDGFFRGRGACSDFRRNIPN